MEIEMKIHAELSEGLAKMPKGERKSFDQVTILLHWLTVFLILFQFTSARLREAVHHEAALAAAILTAHRTAGVLTWFIGLTRLAWRHSFAYLPPFPESMSKLQQTLAKANEHGLYVLLLVQPITGLSSALFHGQPFELIVWEVPALLAPNPEIRSVFIEAHEFGAKALIALIGLHAAAALFHHFVIRDDVLQRMLPRTTSPSLRARRSKGKLALARWSKD
jgi:cytochrome b561